MSERLKRIFETVVIVILSCFSFFLFVGFLDAWGYLDPLLDFFHLP